jgi:hypothetical protein
MKNKENSKENPGFIPVFRSGTHTDSSGREKTYTNVDLDTIVEKYNQRKGEQPDAPICIGHPKTDSPAWGWIEKFKRVGNFLLAKPKRIVPEFAEAIRRGMFRYLSISLRPDLAVRHLAVLGGTPPAVQGLGDLTNYFNEEEEYSTYSFDYGELNAYQVDSDLTRIGRIFRKLREFLIEKFGIEVADKIAENWDIDRFKRSALLPEPENPSFAEQYNMQEYDETPVAPEADRSGSAGKKVSNAQSMQKINPLKEDNMLNGTPPAGVIPQAAPPGTPGVTLAAGTNEPDYKALYLQAQSEKEAAIQQRDAAFSETEAFKTQQKEEAVKGFLEKMRAKIPPAMHGTVRQLIGQIDGEKTFSFSESDGTQKEKTPLGLFFEFCEEMLPDVIPLDKLPSAQGGTPVPVAGDAEFSEGEQKDLHEKVEALRQKEGISYTEAFNRIRRK